MRDVTKCLLAIGAMVCFGSGSLPTAEAGVVFQEDFESYNVGDTPSGDWSANVDVNREAKIYNTGAVSGTKSLGFIDNDSGWFPYLSRSFSIGAGQTTLQWNMTAPHNPESIGGSWVDLQPYFQVLDGDGGILAAISFRSHRRARYYWTDSAGNLAYDEYQGAFFGGDTINTLRISIDSDTGEVVFASSTDGFDTTVWTQSKTSSKLAGAVPGSIVLRSAVPASKTFDSPYAYIDDVILTSSTVAVPEPISILLLGAGTIGMSLRRQRK